MPKELRSLRSLHRMPLPTLPRVESYSGAAYVKNPHHVVLFPAILRERGVAQADSLLEDGQSSCFFHPKFAATAVCDVSGRMICDLCKTQWNGQTVSFEALQTLAGKKKGQKHRTVVQTRWDTVALVLATLPLIMWFLTIVTAPIALAICLWKWRKGPTSVVRTSRWRYLVAGLLALIQIGFWIWLLVWGANGG